MLGQATNHWICLLQRWKEAHTAEHWHGVPFGWWLGYHKMGSNQYNNVLKTAEIPM